MPNSLIPYFFTNNNAIAQLAAKHLLSRGLRHFAYCGYPRNPINGWSEERERTFVLQVASHGFSCPLYHGHHKDSHDWAGLQRALGEWLISLPKPCGLMAANDNRGRQVLEASRACKLRVPEDVAVIAVDNDELLCGLSSPMLSSIEQGAKRLGYEAASLLENLMDGKKLSGTRWVIDPVGVVPRRSTEVLAIDEPHVSQAMTYISQHFAEGIKAADVIKAAALSRSALENRFKAVLGCTIHTAIRQLQLERTRRLIFETNLPLKQIAVNVGFRSVQHMTTLFGKAIGQSPAKYRQGGGAQWSGDSSLKSNRQEYKMVA
jgi:LacI family transcriptional regulator